MRDPAAGTLSSSRRDSFASPNIYFCENFERKINLQSLQNQVKDLCMTETTKCLKSEQVRHQPSEPT